MGIASINPATGWVIKTFEADSDEAVESKLSLAINTFQTYRHTPLSERAAGLARAAQILEDEKNKLGAMMTAEMGKPFKAAVEEAAKCAWACRYYAENGEAMLRDEPVSTAASRSFIRYLPIGPVLAVMPWNFPFWQVFRFAAPALMAGNVGLLKHASNVPQCALAIEDVFLKAGFPRGAFQTLLIGSGKVADLIRDSRVKAVTLTGSEPAGRQVAAEAGKEIKKTVLELGGSDPFVVMPSADLDLAATTAAKARTINNGQSCIAAKRFIVHEQIAEEFQARFVNTMRFLKVGDPMDESTDIGPLATEDIVRELEEQVQRTIQAGAILLTGGKRVDVPGYFYEPTVLTNIPENSPAYRDELFGPVASLFIVPSIDEAIRVANDTSFGLGASAWTADSEEQERFENELEAGLVFINGMVASDPRLPFGGVKNSGYGRELSSYGLREFVNIKSVWVK